MSVSPEATNQQVEAMLAEFARQPGISPAHIQHFRAVLAELPSLTGQLSQAHAQVDLAGFKPLPPGQPSNIGGWYNPGDRHLYLKPELFIPTIGDEQLAEVQVGNAIFTMAHELSHVQSRQAMAQADTPFWQALETKAQQPGVRDYTPEILTRMEDSRRDEASAQIAAYNAMVDWVKQTNPSPSLGDIYKKHRERMSLFIDEREEGDLKIYTIKHGMHLNPDMSMPDDAINRAEVQKHHFDKGGFYPHYYAVGFINAASHYERHYNPDSPMLTLDMAALKVTPAELQRQGFDFGSPNAPPMPYCDIGTQPPACGHFYHGRTAPGQTRSESQQQAPEEAARQSQTQQSLDWDKLSLNDLTRLVLNSDSQQLAALSKSFADSEQGREMKQLGDKWLQEQKAEELAQAMQKQQEALEQQQAMTRSGPVMRL